MTTPDLINGLFEGASSLTIWLNVRAILRDKAVKGFSPVPLIFFASWGYWNLFYYPHLNQWLSFFGGVSMVIANTVYIFLVLKYRGE